MSLFPLFDKDCDLVGWINPGKHIFSTEMEWVAYIKNNHAWSSETGNWIGPVDGLLCLDTAGKPVAWNPKEGLRGKSKPSRPSRATRASRPSRPSRPSRSSRPSRPSSPSGGWSDLSFFGWLSN